jgi:precorrin-2 dehydrogenase / sirohydrochlorin ferrochelatase
MSHGYPIFLDVSNRPAVIIGGGAVAARKASGLITAGAKQIKAVAPKFIRDFPAEVEKITASFAPEHLEGAALVFAATDSVAANDAVVAEARRRGLPVNRADSDEDDPADFVVPAVLRCGAITVAVSAAGSPALASAIRDQVAGFLGDDWINLADALRQLRPLIKSAGLPIAKRREIFRALATPTAAQTLADGGISALGTWIRGQFPELPALSLSEGDSSSSATR